MLGILPLRLAIAMAISLFFFNMNAQVEADFTYSATEGCGSLQVSFCDASTSTGAEITEWLWDLGGVSSSQECPGRIFGSTGSYTVCLTVTDSNGDSDTECKTDLINVYEIPVPNFTADQTSGCAPFTVNFLDLSTSADAAISEWYWELSGPCGTQVITDPASPSISCTYEEPGSYDATLTVIDANGCTGTISIPDFITVHPDPIAEFEAYELFSCSAPHTVIFENQTFHPEVEYTWNFGNGESYTGANPPAITYQNDGFYDVSLTATNNITGCFTTTVSEDLIQVSWPIAFDLSSFNLCAGETLMLTDNSLNPADSIRWEFGDGTFSTQTNGQKVYDFPGCYPITLRRYINGCETNLSSVTCVTVRPVPEVSFSNNNSLGCELPHVVNFVGMSATAQSWSWDFGDGTPMEANQYPVHSFNDFGTFEVSLTVTNAQGCSSTFSDNSIEVRAVEAMIEPAQFSGCSPLEVTFAENSNSISPLTNWNWTIQTNQGIYDSNLEQGTFSIPDTGVWDVILAIENTLGCIDIDTLPRSVFVGMLPVVDFVADPLEECIDTDIQFTDLSSNFAETWRWDFGDGDIEVTQNAVHQYQDTGYYDISLTAGHNGCENTTTISDYIHIKEPLSKFNISLDCDEPFRRFFNDQSVGAQLVYWDFGVEGIESDTSTQWNPQFEFPSTGTYTVTQTVFNAATTCEHSTTRTIQVTNPAANFSLNTNSGCVPLNVQVEDLSDFAVEWAWNAPGGVLSNNQFPEPNINYENPGSFSNIELMITDVNGCRDTFVLDETIFVNGIDVNFEFDPANGCNPLPVNFEETATNLFANNIQWDWDFGDGTSGTSGQNVIHTFEAEGLYNVTLSIRDDWGCSNEFTIENAIDVAQPVALFSTVDTLSCTDHCVRFDNHSRGNGLEFLWDFGDGSFSQDEHPQHCYQLEGTYTVCLTVVDLYGCDSMTCIQNYIEIADPVAAFFGDPLWATCPPMEVAFDNESINANYFTWILEGPLDTTHSFSPSYTYNTPGLYDVTLIASSTPFCTDSLTIEDLVQLEGPTGEFSFSIDTTCTPVPVSFSGTSTEPYEYIWHFGNGEIMESGSGILLDSIEYLYETPGTFTASLELIDLAGCSRMISHDQDIYISQLDVQFAASDSLLCNHNDPVIFSNLSSSTDPILFSHWYFEGGDVEYSNDLEPLINYDNPGSFDVQLIVGNEFCEDTLFSEDFISVGSIPLANFTTSISEGCAPLLVQTTNLSSVANSTIVEWNWDFGNGQTSTIPEPNTIYTSGNDYEITLTVVSETGCSAQFTQVVEVSDVADIELIEDQTICIGGSTQLSANILGEPDGLFYSWSPATGLSCTQCFDPIASPTDSTTYTFTVTNADGCISTSNMKVAVLPFTAPEITLSNDTTICLGEFVQLNANGGADVYEYQWLEDQEGLSCYDNCFNPIANPVVPTNYRIVVTNAYGCSSKDSVRVNVLDERTPFAGPDQVICEGDGISLQLEGGIEPLWINPEGLNCTYCPDPVASPETTTTYRVEVTSPGGCRIIDSVVVEIVDESSVNAGEDVAICVGESIQFEGEGRGIISWFPRHGLSDPAILDPQANPVVSTTYILESTLGNCILRDSVHVEVRSKTEIYGNDLEICTGDSVRLKVDGEFDVINWYLEDNFLTDDHNATIQPESDLFFTAIAQWRNCPSDTTSFQITVNEKPQFDLPHSFQFISGQPIQIQAEFDESKNYEFKWIPSAGLNCNNCPDPILVADSAFVLTVLVEDPSNGCIGTFKTEILPARGCPENLFYLPNVFSPNGDGENDEFEVFASPAIDQNILSYEIVDRWGTVVFSADDFTVHWDGYFKTQKLPQGIYMYRINYICPVTNRREVRYGDVLILY